jgi:hypothetical protein
MLLIEATISVACPKDTNLAEVVEIGKTRVSLSTGGHRLDPLYAGAVVVGLPFGTQSVPVPAPLDLLPGDRLRVTADAVERDVWDVTRKGKVVWENKAVKEAEAAAAAEKAAKREVAERLRL